ncbi:hypothetical protein J6590_066334 [Homalodisca vitripennis]|nr:hypothetical protein J6590_066334 [Homalodisca vitripennis]
MGHAPSSDSPTPLVGDSPKLKQRPSTSATATDSSARLDSLELDESDMRACAKHYSGHGLSLGTTAMLGVIYRRTAALGSGRRSIT